MSPDTSENSAEESVTSDAVTLFHRNSSRRTVSSRSESSVYKAIDKSLHQSAQLVSRSAHKAAKVTKAGIKHSVSGGRAICLRHPRAFSILLGVLLPLWLIIFMSLGFGYFLSLVEAPNEGEIDKLLEIANVFKSYWTHRKISVLSTRSEGKRFLSCCAR
jgi:hypothetical protein